MSLLLTLACTGGTLDVDGTGLDSAPTLDSDSGGSDSADTGTGPQEVSFQDDVVPLFYSACGAATAGCHARDAYAADADNGCNGWLSLEDAPLGSTYDGEPTGCDDRDLYTRLTQLVSWQCKVNGTADNGNHELNWHYVAKGNLEVSYLWQKVVTGGILCDSPNPGSASQPMPIAGPLPDDELDLIKRWITAGAPDN